jgi:hypothetical protein
MMSDPRKDPYALEGKLPEPTMCPKCHATYRKGRWTWSKAETGAKREKCPACRRTEERFPAGLVKLGGKFLAEHRSEVLNVVIGRETRAKAEHPMQRIIAVEQEGADTVVSTTDPHLARSIARAVHEAFKGDLEIRYSRDEHLVRARWRR